MEKNSGMCKEQCLHFDRFDKNFPCFWPKLLIMNSQSGANLGTVHSPLKTVVLFWKC